MCKYLVIFSDNHGDEFDVSGFKLMSEKESDRFEDLASSINFEFNYYANAECLTYSNGEDFLSRFEFKLISNDEYDKLNKLFAGEFGTFIGEEYLKNVLQGDEEDNEDFDINDNNDLDDW
jgi:hypothetical protein